MLWNILLRNICPPRQQNVPEVVSGFSASALRNNLPRSQPRTGLFTQAARYARRRTASRTTSSLCLSAIGRPVRLVPVRQSSYASKICKGLLCTHAVETLQSNLCQAQSICRRQLHSLSCWGFVLCSWSASGRLRCKLGELGGTKNGDLGFLSIIRGAEC